MLPSRKEFILARTSFQLIILEHLIINH